MRDVKYIITMDGGILSIVHGKGTQKTDNLKEALVFDEKIAAVAVKNWIQKRDNVVLHVEQIETVVNRTIIE